MRSKLTAIVAIAMFSSVTRAQVIVPGADGSDGAFNPTSNVTIDLSLAPDGAWDGVNPNPGQGTGVYDADKWAIVFRYSSVNIPSGVTVSFRNRNYNGLLPGNPPVVWLVSGTVTINGIVTVKAHADPSVLGFYMPGPGGFRGAGTNGATGGLGPGGSGPGATCTNGIFGRYASSYGNSRVLPLIGGSGCGSSGGGAGGGAILIAAPGTITINGDVRADGGHANCAASISPGSGGGIRLVCHRLQGTGTIYAASGNGDNGRIRLEANENALSSVGNPLASVGLPGATATLWPDDLVAPSVRVISLGTEAIPAEPAAKFEFPYADVNLTSGASQILVIEATNVPTGGDPPGTPAWTVRARVVPRGGGTPLTVNAAYQSGNYALSTWHATLNLPDGTSAIQVRAAMP